MEQEIKEYAEAVTDHIRLSQEETSVKVKLMAAKARVQKARELMRAKEEELLEPKI